MKGDFFFLFRIFYEFIFKKGWWQPTRLISQCSGSQSMTRKAILSCLLPSSDSCLFYNRCCNVQQLWSPAHLTCGTHNLWYVWYLVIEVKIEGTFYRMKKSGDFARIRLCGRLYTMWLCIKGGSGKVGFKVNGPNSLSLLPAHVILQLKQSLELFQLFHGI